ncbi:helix-turn-helix transcriptional regulator, partial [Dysosmobacter welbionis]
VTDGGPVRLHAALGKAVPPATPAGKSGVQPLHQGRDVRPIGLDKGIDVGGLRSREHRRQTAGGLCGCVCQLSGSVRPRGGL